MAVRVKLSLRTCGHGRSGYRSQCLGRGASQGNVGVRRLQGRDPQKKRVEVVGMQHAKYEPFKPQQGRWVAPALQYKASLTDEISGWLHGAADFNEDPYS